MLNVAIFTGDPYPLVRSQVEAGLRGADTRLGISRAEFADWVVAWCGLSLTWASEAGQDLACRTVAERLITSRW